MRVRLRVVAERALGPRVVLLREQAGGAGELEHLVEQRLGVALAADERVGVREPERAEVESALAARQAVVAAVAIDGRALAQPQLDRLDGRREALVVGGQQPAEPDLQGGGVEVDAVVGGRERAHLGLPAALQHVGGDAVGEHRPAGARGAAGEAREPSARSTASQHITRECTWWRGGPADLPDAVVGLVPAALDGVDDLLDQQVMGLRERAAGDRDRVGQLDDRPEDVELHLLRRGVADAHGPAARRSPGRRRSRASVPASPPSTE